MKNIKIFFLIILLTIVTGIIVVMAESDYFRETRLTLRDGAYRMLMNKLSQKVMIPRDENDVSKKKETMIYVLGGNQESLKYHFQTAAALYKERIADTICILSRPGSTEYSPELFRNLTNDEWAVWKLKGLGVPARDVEAVPVPSGFYGTYSEGARISRFARDRGYKRLVLVVSRHHARRAYLTFSHFLGGGIDLYVYGSRDSANLVTLLVEYGKLFWYRWVLLPVSSPSFHAHAVLNIANRDLSNVEYRIRFRSDLRGRKGEDTVWIL